MSRDKESTKTMACNNLIHWYYHMDLSITILISAFTQNLPKNMEFIICLSVNDIVIIGTNMLGINKTNRYQSS